MNSPNAGPHMGFIRLELSDPEHRRLSQLDLAQVLLQDPWHELGRDDLVHDAGVAGAPRHPVEAGARRLLHQGQPADLLDGADAAHAVRAGAGEDDADGPVALILGEGAEEDVDREAHRAVGGLVGEAQLPVLDLEVLPRRDEVDGVGLDGDALVGAGYGSAGERCMAISVAVPVGEATANALREKLTDRVRSLRVGHPLDPKSDYGPLVTAAARDRVIDYIDQGVKAGAELVVDGRAHTSDESTFEKQDLSNGFYLGPTLFDHVTKDMSIYTDEIFGPVLVIIAYDSVNEAVEIANGTVYGLGAHVQGRDIDAARAVAARIRSGQVHINNPPWRPDVPFGGYKRSGNGREYGLEGMEEYLETKAILGYAPTTVPGAL